MTTETGTRLPVPCQNSAHGLTWCLRSALTLIRLVYWRAVMVGEEANAVAALFHPSLSIPARETCGERRRPLVPNRKVPDDG